MYSHCTHLTHIGSAVQSIGWVTNYDSKAIIWVWLCKTTSAAAQAARLVLAFVLGLLIFFCFAVSAVWWTLSRSILCFLFSSVVCGVLRGSLQEHNGPISAGELPLRFTLRTCETAINAFSNFHNATQQIQQKYEVLTVRRMNTYIHTYVQTLLVFNMLMWGSLRLTSTRAATWFTRSYEFNCWSY